MYANTVDIYFYYTYMNGIVQWIFKIKPAKYIMQNLTNSIDKLTCSPRNAVHSKREKDSKIRKSGGQRNEEELIYAETDRLRTGEGGVGHADIGVVLKTRGCKEIFTTSLIITRCIF